MTDKNLESQSRKDEERVMFIGDRRCSSARGQVISRAATPNFPSSMNCYCSTCLSTRKFYEIEDRYECERCRRTLHKVL